MNGLRVSLMVLLMVGLMVLVLAGPALAQELITNTPVGTAAYTVTDAAGNVTSGVAPVHDGGLEPEFFILAAVTLGLLAALVLVLKPLIVQLGTSSPAWAVEAAFSAVGSLLDSMAKAAEKTPPAVDDELMRVLQEEIAKLKGEVLKMRIALPKTAAPDEQPEAGPLPEGLAPPRDYTQPPGTSFGDVKRGEETG